MQTGIMDYIEMILRRKQLFLYPFIITVFFVVVASFVLPKTYESTSVILIEEQNVINPLVSDLAVSTSVAERLRVLKEQILSWTSLTELVRRLNLDANVRSKLAYENLIKQIRKNIMVELKGPQIVMISYQGRNPEQVQLVAKTLTDIFIQQNVQSQTTETSVAVKFLEDQLKFYRRKIREDEIKGLQQKLNKLLIDSTPQHPLVKSLKERIAKLTADLNSDNPDLKIKSTTSSNHNMISYLLLNELRKNSGQQQDQSSDTMDTDMTSQPLSIDTLVGGSPLDTKVNEDIYGMLLKRLQTARITEKLENFKEGTHFKIIDPPRLPLKPVKPNPIKFLMLGIFLGAGVGYGFIYLAQMLDTSFSNINEAKEHLKYPILGAISTIILEHEFNRRKRGARFIYALMAIFFILIVVIVFVFSAVR